MEAVSPGHSGRSEVFDTRIVARRLLSPKAFELILAKPPGFAFAPGQRMRLRLEETERDYSIASAPDEAAIRLCIRQVESGRISDRLCRTAEGTALTFTGPHGYFIFQPSARPAVFVATGTGVAPFRAMAAAGVTRFILLHGVSAAPDLHYQDFLRPRASIYAGCLSDDPAAAADHFEGRVTEYLQRRLPAGAYDFYLCGRQDMVRDAILLIDERFPGSSVFTEVFY